MARNSADFLKQTKNDTFTVSVTGGNTVVTDQHWAQGIVRIGVSTLSHSYPVVIKDLPYDFRIVGCSFNTTAMTASAAMVASLFNTATNATGFLCTMALTASRYNTVPTTLNFNKTNVSKTHTLKLVVSSISAELCAGILHLRVIPI